MSSIWKKLEALGTPYFFQKAYSNQRAAPGVLTVQSEPKTDDEREAELELYGEDPEVFEVPQGDPQKHGFFVSKRDLSLIDLDSEESAWSSLELMISNGDL